MLVLKVILFLILLGIGTIIVSKDGYKSYFRKSITPSPKNNSLKYYMSSIFNILLLILILIGFSYFSMIIYYGIEVQAEQDIYLFSNLFFSGLMYCFSIFIFVYHVILYINIHINSLQTKAYNKAILDFNMKIENLNRTENQNISFKEIEKIYKEIYKSEQQMFELNNPD